MELIIMGRSRKRGKVFFRDRSEFPSLFHAFQWAKEQGLSSVEVSAVRVRAR